MAIPTSNEVSEFFQSQIRDSKDEAEADLWRGCDRYYSKRLWHQLTTQLELVVAMLKSKDKGSLLQLYEKAIREFESKLNPLTLVCICSTVISDFDNVDAALSFLENLGDRVRKSWTSVASSLEPGNDGVGGTKRSQINEEAYTYTKILRGRIYLAAEKTDLTKAKSLMEESEEILNGLEGVGKVHKEFYIFSSLYYKILGDHAQYYHASLRYLGCSELDERSKEENVSLATHLCLAALLGKNIYNFGELLAHPILQVLDGGENQWLVDTLKSFNRGDVAEFRSMQKRWSQQPDLGKNEELLYEKICLLAIMEMTFKKSATDRQLAFGEISEVTGLPMNKIELLVMKALSRGLIKGKIDQVGEVVHVDWVQPRVLDPSQLASLMVKLDKWGESISNMEKLIETNAGDILTV